MEVGDYPGVDTSDHVSYVVCVCAPHTRSGIGGAVDKMRAYELFTKAASKGQHEAMLRVR